MSLASEGSGSLSSFSGELRKAAGRGGRDNLGAFVRTAYGHHGQLHGMSSSGMPTPPVPGSATPPSSSTSNNAPTGAAAPPEGQLFDPAADPVYQQVQAQMSAANQMAQGQMLSQEEQQLLQLGDPALAQAMLGANDPMVAAVSGNPESEYAQLQRQYEQQLQQFGENIDPSLVNSGYRVLQEGNMAQALQDQRSAAASQAQSAIQGLQDQYASTQAQNADTQSQALADAYNRYVQQYLANPPAGSSGGSGGSTGPSGGTTAPPKKTAGSTKNIAHRSRHRGGGGRTARAS